MKEKGGGGKAKQCSKEVGSGYETLEEKVARLNKSWWLSTLVMNRAGC